MGTTGVGSVALSRFSRFAVLSLCQLEVHPGLIQIKRAYVALICFQANLISWYGPLDHRKEDGLITHHTFHAIIQASYNDLPGSIQLQVIWDLWYTDVDWCEFFFPNTSVPTASIRYANCSMLSNRPIIVTGTITNFKNMSCVINL
jgi:hypothetical protein